MGVFDELQARGLIAQMTNEEKIREELNHGKIAFYMELILRRTACMSAILYRLWSWPICKRPASADRLIWRGNRHDWRSLR